MATRQNLEDGVGGKAAKSAGKGAARGGASAGDAATRKKRVAIMTAAFVVLLGIVVYVYTRPDAPPVEEIDANVEPQIDPAEQANEPPPPPRPEPSNDPNNMSEEPIPVPG